MSAITLTLERIARTGFATYGQIIDTEQKQWCVTLELPWQENAPNESCVPSGAYTAIRFPSPGHGYDVFELRDVPERSAIEMHIGNLPHDTKGCILLGSNYGTVNGQPGITGSAAAFARFMDALRGVESFTLVILNPQPELSQ